MHPEEYAQKEYAQTAVPHPSTLAVGEASARLAQAQDQMWKAIEELASRVAHLLGQSDKLSEVLPDEPSGTAFHNYAHVAEMQAYRLRDLTERLEV